jgi:hypothetical protein
MAVKKTTTPTDCVNHPGTPVEKLLGRGHRGTTDDLGDTVPLCDLCVERLLHLGAYDENTGKLISNA